MDQRYNFEERIKRIERKLMVGAIFSISLGIAVFFITYIVMYELTIFLGISVASIIAIAAIIFLIYREMDEVDDEDLPALIREKTLHIVFAIIAGGIVTYLLRL